uniref:Uncharacterized protein n=1 Tax=Romanomermis culicivorax TaxID=13658 RepID=A0A915JVB8_ROMCU
MSEGFTGDDAAIKKIESFDEICSLLSSIILALQETQKLVIYSALGDRFKGQNVGPAEDGEAGSIIQKRFGVE